MKKKKYLTNKEYKKIKQEFLKAGNKETIIKGLRKYLDEETAKAKIKELLEMEERINQEFKRLGGK